MKKNQQSNPTLVCIVTYMNCDNYTENRGVYSSRHKAYKAIKKMMSEPKSYLTESPEKERKFYKIETWILDD